MKASKFSLVLLSLSLLSLVGTPVVRASCLSAYDRAIIAAIEDGKEDQKTLADIGSYLISGKSSGSARNTDRLGIIWPILAIGVNPVFWAPLGLSVFYTYISGINFGEIGASRLETAKSIVFASTRLQKNFEMKNYHAVEVLYDLIEDEMGFYVDFYGMELTKSDIAEAIMDLDSVDAICKKDGTVMDLRDLAFTANQYKILKGQGKWEATKKRLAGI